MSSRANPIRRQRFLDHRGRLLAEIDVERFWAGVGGCVAIERAALHDVLLEATEDVTVRARHVGDGARDAATCRGVTFSDGSSRSYDLVVGADGVHSTVRALALGGPAARYVGQASWRFLAQGFPESDAWTVRLGRGRAFLTVPLGREAVYCYADLNTDDPAGAAAGTGAAAFADFAEPVPSLLEQADDAYFAPIEEVVAARVDGARSRPRRRRRPRRLAEHGAGRGDGHRGRPRACRSAHDRSAPSPQALASTSGAGSQRVAWVQEQTHRRDRTRSLPPPALKLVLRLAGERIFRLQLRPAPRGAVAAAQPTMRWLSPNSCQR